MAADIDPEWWAQHVENGHHDGRCEQCEEPMNVSTLVEGDLGFYCSQECCDKSEL